MLECLLSQPSVPRVWTWMYLLRSVGQGMYKPRGPHKLQRTKQNKKNRPGSFPNRFYIQVSTLNEKDASWSGSIPRQPQRSLKISYWSSLSQWYLDHYDSFLQLQPTRESVLGGGGNSRVPSYAILRFNFGLTSSASWDIMYRFKRRAENRDVVKG